MTGKYENKPSINVTPLIDVLLVLLIIFMVVSPLKPSRFEAKVPAKSKPDGALAHIHSLIVTISPDRSLALNQEMNLGTVSEPEQLVRKLSETFQKRLENQVYAEGMELKNDLPESEKIQKTVFIKAPRDFPYGEVTKVVDSVKLAGADPIGLQIDDLE
jgi:biopolymer transport protein ExbD